MRYAHYSDDEINRHFMPRLAVPDHETWTARGAALSDAAKARLHGARLDLAYGDTPLQTLDVFPAAHGDAPIHVYIHGGYWRALDKNGYAYVAGSLVPAGATTVLTNYDLCPAVTLDDIASETYRALGWIYRNAAALGGDARRLHVSGSSAGAHLLAMALAHDWTGDGLPADLIKGACCITGIYDVEPVLRIPANDDIRLQPAMIERNSPLFLKPRTTAPVIVAVGADEPALWIRQSTDYEAMLRAHGVATELIVVPGTHHFSITQSLAEPDGRLIQAIRRQMGL